MNKEYHEQGFYSLQEVDILHFFVLMSDLPSDD